MRILFLVFVAAAFGLQVTGAWAGEKGGAFPHPGAAPGERLQYNIHWMGLPGAKAVMRFLKGGDGGYRINATLEAIGGVKFFFPIRDELTSDVRWKGGAWESFHYVKDQREGKKTMYSDYRFNREAAEVIRTVDGQEKVFPEAPEGINGPLGVFYSVRTRETLTPGEEFAVPMVDGDKFYPARVQVGKKQKMFTPLGWFEVVPIYPIVSSSDLFRHRGKMAIWVTTDERRLPVRVETKIRVGTAAADLVAYEDGRGGSGRMKLEEN